MKLIFFAVAEILVDVVNHDKGKTTVLAGKKFYSFVYCYFTSGKAFSVIDSLVCLL